MKTLLHPGSRPATGASPADVYEAMFVPALFGPWAPVVCAEARVASGQRVLDVACGTGVLAQAAQQRAAPGGHVVGLDANPQMLAVARRERPGIEWRDGRAESLPFADASFDRVLSQFALMFFDDRVQALQEMARVLRPDGRWAVAVFDALARSPGYAELAALLQRLFGDEVAAAFRSPWALGDADRLLALCDAARLPGAQLVRRSLDVRFPSIDALISAEQACVWTLGGLLDDGQIDRLRREARSALRAHVDADGAARFPVPALIACGAAA